MSVNKFLISILVVCVVIGIDHDCNSYRKIYPEEHPIMNLPLELRQRNYDNGSCVWATTISLLRWQGEYELADEVRNIKSGGVYLDELFDELDSVGVTYASTCNGDESFLEWACYTRRGAGIAVMDGRHMLALVDINEGEVCLLDNNSVEKYLWLPRDIVMRDWKSSGGYAFSPVYSPTAPLP